MAVCNVECGRLEENRFTRIYRLIAFAQAPIRVLVVPCAWTRNGEDHGLKPILVLGIKRNSYRQITEFESRSESRVRSPG